jgi:hypothetical protein
MERFRFQSRGDEESAVSWPLSRAGLIDGRDLLRAFALGRKGVRRLLRLELDAVVARVGLPMVRLAVLDRFGDSVRERGARHRFPRVEVFAPQTFGKGHHGFGPFSLA